MKIIIIGGGFAGLSAAERLCRSGLKLEVTLIDKKQSFDFLPLLPDCIGRRISTEFISYSIEEAGSKLGFKFLHEQVMAIDLDKREVLTNSGRLDYDYLLISSGTETNFYGNDFIKQHAYALDEANDARRIIKALKENEYDNFIVAGGGYTGIEVATNLRLYLNKHKKNGKVIIVERAPAILGPLPEWMRGYVTANLERLNIEALVNSTIDKIELPKIYLSGNRILDNAFLIWAAGVKTAKFIQDLKVEKNAQGRIKIDAYSRLNENCFVVGDAANFSYKNSFLRMAVQFAITQGDSAAANIIRNIEGLSLNEYRPQDLGYIIPMANNSSCGMVFGLSLKGLLPTIFHFIMCIYRLQGLKNKFGIIKDLTRR
jgi:NADH dehydrogenase FAD-containing subunit